MGIDFIVALVEDPTASLSARIRSDSYFDYVHAVNEGHAVAMTAGAALAGRKCVFITGCAGTLVSAWALSQTALLYRLPFVMLISYRGDIGDKSSGPLGIGEQLYLMGSQIEPLLSSLRIPYRIVSESGKLGSAILDAHTSAHQYNMPVAVLMTGDVLW